MHTIMKILLAVTLGVQYTWATQNLKPEQKSSYHNELLSLKNNFSQEKSFSKKWAAFELFRRQVETQNSLRTQKKSKEQQNIDMELETYLFMIRIKSTDQVNSCKKAIIKVESSVKKQTAQSLEVIELLKKLCQ